MLQAYNQGEFKLVSLETKPEATTLSARGAEPFPAKDAGYRDLLN
jgi:hypothetical protein